MTFETNTYVVLDVPEPFASAVMAVRVKHRDDFRSSLPVEITVAGSNGVGELEADQPSGEVFRRIVTSSMRFKPCPFPYQPHCTLRDRTPISDEETADLLAVTIPGSFVLETLSVYAMPPPMLLLHRVRLGSALE